MIIFYDKPGKKISETVGLANVLSQQSNQAVAAYCLRDLEVIIEAATAPQVSIDGQDIANVGPIYFRTISRARDLAAIAADYLEERQVNYVDAEAATNMTLSKLHQMYLLHKQGIPIPDTYYGNSDFVQSLIGNQLSFPFIYKAVVASKGASNYLVQNLDEFAQVSTKQGERFIAQKFIPNQADYRLLVFGNEVKLIIRRSRNDDGHLNNTSQGAKAELIPIEEFDQSVNELAVHAAKILRRDVAGVDIIIDQNGLPFVLEVNRTPQLATGSFVDEKLRETIQYLQGL